MRQDHRPDGKYASISPTKSGIFYGKIVEVWEGYQWYVSHCLDTSIIGVHHWLCGHGIAYNNIELTGEK